MRTAARWFVVVVTVAHGLLHLLGVAKGFGWAEPQGLTEPISMTLAWCWLVASVLLLAAGALLATRVRWWWAVGLVAALVSQAVILTSWTDARAGTLANLLLLVAALHGLAAEGPWSFRRSYRHLADEAAAAGRALAEEEPAVVTEADLAGLPAPVAAYVVASGAVGRPRVRGFRARISGGIRGGADESWMPFTGEQVDVFGPAPRRVFSMDATMRHLPTDVLHTYLGDEARMRARVFSVVPVLDVAGPEMTQAETVTLFNDLCILAPAALVGAGVEWEELDDHRVRGTYRNAGHLVRAELVFDDQHRLVDFVSDDRLRSSADGRTMTPERWSTPLGDHRCVDGRWLSMRGAGRWHPAGAPAFDYLDFHVDGITWFEDPVEARSGALVPAAS